MAGAGSSETILFIGAMLAAVIVVVGLNGVAGQLGQGMDERAQALGEQLRTRIEVINDPLNMPTDPLVLYIKNTGTTDLWVPDFVVLVDGHMAPNVTYSIHEAEDSFLRPGGLVTVTVNDLALDLGDHRVQVVTANGSRTNFEFVV